MFLTNLLMVCVFQFPPKQPSPIYACVLKTTIAILQKPQFFKSLISARLRSFTVFLFIISIKFISRLKCNEINMIMDKLLDYQSYPLLELKKTILV